MAAQILDLQLTGLYISPNNLSGTPPGSLAIADNVVINNKNIISSRRGQTQYGTALTLTPPGQVNKLFNYVNSLILNYQSKLAYDSGSGTWVDYSGSYTVPNEDYKMRSLEALRNIYFTTSQGILKIDALTATPRIAGVVEALGGTGSVTGSSGFLLENSSVAYRILWGYEDANNNLILGAPSQRLVVTNPSGSGASVDVALTYQIPASITTEYFYQIYRSLGTATDDDEPTDELQLVIQGNPTSAEITAKSFSVTDVTPYDLMRAFLYTSPSQEGISNANFEPPLAIDMDIFKNSAFYANTEQKQVLTLTIISVESPSLGYFVDATVGSTAGTKDLTGISSTADLRVGMRVVGSTLQADSIITAITSGTTVTINKDANSTATVSMEFQDRFSIGGVDYWAGSVYDLATRVFVVDTSGTAGQNINSTALSLVQLINAATANTTLYAYYISALDDLPGTILFRARNFGQAAFTATSTAGSSWTPELPDQYLIITNSIANPTVVTSVTDGVSTIASGNTITVYNSNSTPTIDGERVVTVTGASTFTIPVNVTVGGNAGYWIETSLMVSSTSEGKQNRVYISKPLQVEAVPLYTFFDIGSANFPIQRVVALRDGIFFFKTDGIYRLSGENFSNFTVSLLDNTVNLIAPESAVPFNNQVFCFTTQGICAVSDSGVQIMSVPIETELLQLSSEQYTYFTSASFGVAYESSRQYMFFTVIEFIVYSSIFKLIPIKLLRHINFPS